MKVTDKASPQLFVKMCEGTNFQKVSLACRKAGGNAETGQSDFIKIDFFDVFISSYNEGGATATDLQPLESISFAFSKVNIQAASVSSEGVVGPFSSAGFDFEANKPITTAAGG
jgi:type VI protein secretion system component Hcp